MQIYFGLLQEYDRSATECQGTPDHWGQSQGTPDQLEGRGWTNPGPILDPGLIN